MKFRKREVIEAQQWWGHGEGEGHPKVIRLPPHQDAKLSQLRKFGWLDTTHGGHRVERGDWIIRNANGVWSSCNPITFAKLYEPLNSYEYAGLPKQKHRDRSA